MLRLEPGYELLALRFRIMADQAKTDESMHFVNVSSDGFAPTLYKAEIGIGADEQQVPFLPMSDAPEQTIERSPASRIAVGRGTARDVDERLGDFGRSV